MKNIFRSVRRHKPQPQTEVETEQTAPFFSKQAASPLAVQSKQGAFFQPKLTIGQPDDQYEREADAVADKVVSHQSTGTVRDAKPSVQRLATPAEEKMPATNDGRMAEDKRIQEKPEVQRAEMPEKKEEEKPAVQKAEAPEKQEEEKPAVQKAEAPEKKEEEKPAVQKAEAPEKKEEEKPAVQKADEPEKKEEEKPAVQKAEAPEKQEEQPAVQAKAEQGGGQKTSAQLSNRIESSRGRGNKLPHETRAQMEASFGRDFSQVTIHTDAASIEMNRDLGAQAFTHGSDVYFGSGKFQPNDTEGKRLLAHELTHVVQQKSPRLKPELQKQDAAPQANRQLPNIATPVPAEAESGAHGTVNMVINGVNVVIQPDVHSRRKGSGGVTSFRQRGGSITGVKLSRRHVTAFSGPSPVTVTIVTTFQRRANPAGPSAYGRGTTPEDQASGDTSLRFHEGSHGTSFLEFLTQNPLPVFTGEVGMTQRAFAHAMREYRHEMRNYFRDMGRQSLMDVDCTGSTTIDDVNHSNVCGN